VLGLTFVYASEIRL